MRKIKARGFTLIEVIISMVVLAIGISSVLAILAHVVESSTQPDAMQTSTFLAQKEMERVSNLRYSQIATQSSTAFTGNFSAYSYQIQVSAVPAALASDPTMLQYKQVAVTVTNPLSGSVTLTSVVTNN